MRQIHSNFTLIYWGLVRGVCLLGCIRKNTYHGRPNLGRLLYLKSAATPSCRDSRLHPEKSRISMMMEEPTHLV
jgi:hypothetical protein